MRPLSAFPATDLRRLRYVLTDIDDTLTNHGRVRSIAYDAMERLSAAGLVLVPITGRPAGWCDLIARQWPVAAVVGENGAFYYRHDEAARRMIRRYWKNDAEREADRQRLQEVKAAILAAVPAARVSADQAFREADLAIDFAEDVGPLPDADIEKIRAIFEAHGAMAKISSIHVNGWFGAYDKLAMTRHLFAEGFGIDLDRAKDQVVFIGDSPNDQPMFAFFPNAVGVANIVQFQDRLIAPPAYVTAGEGGNGFAELAAALLTAKVGIVKTDDPTPIARKDYRPPDYTIRSIDLDIALDPTQTIVTARLEVAALTTERVPLKLNGQALELRSLKLGGHALAEGTDYAVDASHLTIFAMPEEAALEIVTCIAPQNNTALEGLYLSRGIYCTQCEAEGFRKITYFLDRPDVLSIYKVRLTAPESCPVLLSNGNCFAAGRTADGGYFAEWHDPFPKPCYLFAAVAGQLEALKDSFRTVSGRDVNLSIWTEPGQAARCAYAMDSLKRAMTWDEEVFGLEYDLDEFNIVAVQDFNMGAMENKSLNVFNAQYILADPAVATDRDYAGIESVVGHEYFHNWTGNRVTCRDWFELCLKEGLTVFREQEFAGDQRSRPLRRIEDVRMLRSRQFPEDAGPLAHPVRPESFIEISNFYTATIYEKGAEVIRMLSVLIGRQAFLQGHRLYIERNDGTAARVDDFLAAMAEASGRDLTAFARWYSEIGTPEVAVESSYKDGTLELSLSQNGPVRVIPLSVGLIDGNGRDIKSDVLILDEKAKSFRFSGLSERPHLSLNRDFSAPIRLKSDLDTKELIFLFGHDSNEFARFEAGQDLAMNFLLAAVRDRKLRPSRDLLDAFAMVLEDERLDHAFIAEALTLPAERMIGDRMDKVDAGEIHRARDMLIRAIADHCRPRLTDLYWSLSAKPFSPDAASAGHRALSNLALALLAADGNADAIELTMRQYISADNMTDRMAALTVLSRHDIPERRVALDDFELRYAGHPLVMNKWLAVQAMAPLLDTLAEVQRLMTHSAFNLKNPNNVRALVGSFASGNPFCFHDPDGSGYRFLSGTVAKLDPINPQIAARLVEPLCQWRRYPDEAAAAMRDCLSPILTQAGLSRDTYEVVSKALAQ